MSRTLFFYGTLCHAPLLDCVLGAGDRGGQGGRVEAAVLDDHLVTWVHGQPFPMIRAEAGAQARGAVLRDVSDQDLARLIFYEGGFDYDLSPVSVQVGAEKVEAEVFFPQPGLWTPGAPWALQDWVDAWGAISLSAAGEVMEQFGTRSAEDIAHLLPFFRARGWARQMAQTSAPRQLRRDLHRNQVRITPRPASAKGFFRLESFALDYPKFDGTRSETIARNAYVAFDAALLLPYDPVSDRVMLVEQLRFGPLMRGDPYPSILEPIAGLVDAGEPPLECARREAAEEVGLALRDIRPMMQSYASPGYSSEFFHFFLGLCPLSDRDSGIGGLEYESEDIRSHVLPFEDAMALVDSGEINAGPLALMLLWLDRARVQLQAEASNG